MKTVRLYQLIRDGIREIAPVYYESRLRAFGAGLLSLRRFRVVETRQPEWWYVDHGAYVVQDYRGQAEVI
jgi:hypothetical protein